MTDEPLRRHRYETINQDETLSVELPDGIGVVHIRTGQNLPMTGNPFIEIEMVSDTLDTPAQDGRYYLPGTTRKPNTMILTGLPEDDRLDFGPIGS